LIPDVVLSGIRLGDNESLGAVALGHSQREENHAGCQQRHRDQEIKFPAPESLPKLGYGKPFARVWHRHGLWLLLSLLAGFSGTPGARLHRLLLRPAQAR